MISLQITNCVGTSDQRWVISIWTVRSEFGRQFYHICGRLYDHNLYVSFDISANHKLCRNIWAEMSDLHMDCYLRVCKIIFITFASGFNHNLDASCQLSFWCHSDSNKVCSLSKNICRFPRLCGHWWDLAIQHGFIVNIFWT